MPGRDGLTFEQFEQERQRQPQDNRFRDFESKQKTRNEKGQSIADRYAGLNGYEYYRNAGEGISELDAVLRKIQAIPADKWIPLLDNTDKKKDRDATLERLKANKPPEFINMKLTASQKEALSVREKKTLRSQLKDYKEMRANWEESNRGKAWKREVERLTDMEKGVKTEWKFRDKVSIDPAKAGRVNLDRKLGRNNHEVRKSLPSVEGRAELLEHMKEKYNGAEYKAGIFNGEGISDGKNIILTGINYSRFYFLLEKSLGEDLTDSEIIAMYDKLMAPHRSDLKTRKAKAEANRSFKEGVRELKSLYYRHLKKIEATYGTLITQMHPEDFLRQIPDAAYDHFHCIQDLAVMLKHAADFFDFENSEEDREFLRLSNYYFDAWVHVNNYNDGVGRLSEPDTAHIAPTYFRGGMGTWAACQSNGDGMKTESGQTIGGPHMTEEEYRNYKKDLQKRAAKGGLYYGSYGRFHLTGYSGVTIDPEKAGKVNMERKIGRTNEQTGPEREEVDTAAIIAIYEGNTYKEGKYRESLQNSDGSVIIKNLIPMRILPEMARSLGENMDNYDIITLFNKLMAPHKKSLNTPEDIKKADRDFDEGVFMLKNIYYRHLKKLEFTYGTLASQMHPEDFLRQAPDEVAAYGLVSHYPTLGTRTEPTTDWCRRPSARLPRKNHHRGYYVARLL